MRMATTYRQILLLLHVLLIKVLTTGHRTIIVSNLKLPTFCFVAIRCQLGTLIPSSTSGLRLSPSTMTHHHFRQPLTCTTQLMPHLSATFRGNPSLCCITELNLLATYRHGCRPSMTSVFGTHVPLCTISSPTQISKPISIMHPSKSALRMVPIASKTSCPGTGPGVKQ
jgi:hypothetical protein